MNLDVSTDSGMSYVYDKVNKKLRKSKKSISYSCFSLCCFICIII